MSGASEASADAAHVALLDAAASDPLAAIRELEAVASDKAAPLAVRVRAAHELQVLTRAQAILKGSPVAEVKADAAPASGGVANWAVALFAQQGGSAVHPLIGEVALRPASVRDSLAHGLSRSKALAFAAVKAVIERGALVASARIGRTDSHCISAPVMLADTPCVVTVLARSDPNTQRMYLHSVRTKESLLQSQTEAGTKNVPERIRGAKAGGVAIVPHLVDGRKIESTETRSIIRSLLLDTATPKTGNGVNLALARARAAAASLARLREPVWTGLSKRRSAAARVSPCCRSSRPPTPLTIEPHHRKIASRWLGECEA